ncbi:MAG: glycosyltransferase, partial [Collinsella intestinalis]|nr:glycosyltransferase [Collinsella intestinalis]
AFLNLEDNSDWDSVRQQFLDKVALLEKAQEEKDYQAELKRQRDAWVDFSIQPTFSFIVPLYKTPSEYLHTMVDSVLAQTYPNLQLVLVNASPELGELRAEVAAYCAKDGRIDVVDLKDNLGITENTNAGLEVATGEFCCFLDHDDYIDADLLFEYVKALNANPQIDVFYCDEDMVIADEHGGGFKHCNPFFKPAYSPELLLSRNYAIHLMTVRRSVLDSMPRPDASFDGSQDFNMILFSTFAARSVCSIPRVMYHWRISDTSTATNPDSKPYSLRSCRKAIDAQLARRGMNAGIVGTGLYLLHDVWLEDASAAAVSIVADVTGCHRDVAWFAEFCQQMFSRSGAELIVVGNQADCDAFGTQYGGTLIVCNDDGRLGRLNAGAAHARGDVLVFVDGDCIFTTPEPLRQLAGWCSMGGIGIAAPKILYRNGTNKSYGVAVTSERIMPMYRGYDDDFPGYQCNLRAMQNVSAVGLQGMCVRRDVFGRIGGFDASFGAEVGAVDLCRRVLNEGLRIVATPTVKIEVDEAAPERRFDCASNAPDYPAADIARFDEKWPGVRAAGDPYLNPNLDQSSSYQQLPARR